MKETKPVWEATAVVLIRPEAFRVKEKIALREQELSQAYRLCTDTARSSQRFGIGKSRSCHQSDLRRAWPWTDPVYVDSDRLTADDELGRVEVDLIGKSAHLSELCPSLTALLGTRTVPKQGKDGPPYFIPSSLESGRRKGDTR